MNHVFMMHTPAINHALELMYASATFQMKELFLPFEHHLVNFVEEAFVEDYILVSSTSLTCGGEKTKNRNFLL